MPFAGVIGGVNGVCAQSMMIDASANTYLLDAETYSLDRIDGTTRNLATIGALGFAFGRAAAMDIDPTSGMLFLYDFDGTHAVYAVDTSSGSAQALAPLGDDFPTMTAFAFGFISAHPFSRTGSRLHGNDPYERGSGLSDRLRVRPPQPQAQSWPLADAAEHRRAMRMTPSRGL